MRAIIIDDKDAKALLDQLALTEFTEKQSASSQVVLLQEHHNIPRHAIAALVGEIHRRFHYRVCNWLQEQGCNVTS